jgi:hypothetical protein
MGIDPAWYVEASNFDTENNEVSWLSRDELVRWHVVTDVPDTKWKLVPRGGQVYLRARSPGSLPDGEIRNELSFSCTPAKTIRMDVYYTPFGPGLINKPVTYRLAALRINGPGPVPAGLNSASEITDLEPASFAERFHEVTPEGPIAGAINLTDRIVATLQETEDLNFRFYTSESLYQGFDVDFKSKRDLFKQFLDVCR